MGQARMFLRLTFEGHRRDMVFLRWYDTDNSVPSQVTWLQRIMWATISGTGPSTMTLWTRPALPSPCTSCLTPPLGPTSFVSTHDAPY